MDKENLVICPVYNEAKTIKEFYRNLRLNYYQDVVFVDDGSTDISKTFLLKIRDKNTFVIRHNRRTGYGEALLSGFQFAREAKYRRIVTLDADLQHNPKHIPIFLRELLEYDIVLGSRYIRVDKYFEAPRTRIIINRYISRLIKIMFSVYFSDPFCGYRGYRDSFLERAFFKEKSYGIGLEILLEIIRKNAIFKEIPIEVIYFNHERKFLDGFDDPRKRLSYYLEVIASRKKEINNEKEVFSCKPSSR